MENELEVYHKWNPIQVGLSYVVASTGSYCAIQLLEAWRMSSDDPSVNGSRTLMLMASIALGGCGIWSMHFTGMDALVLALPDGTDLPQMQFEGFLTILSFILAVGAVFCGLVIASKDPFFLEILNEKRKQIIVADMKDSKITDLTNKTKAMRKIKIVALLSNLHRIVAGGFVTALGVLGMHYTGMLAQRTSVKMTFIPEILIISCLIAFVTACAAFWILFRLLTFWPNYVSLRMASALVMGVAVCGTHYSGMYAATFVYHPNVIYDTGFLLNSSIASHVASHGALLICFFMTEFGVVNRYRSAALVSAKQRKSTSVGLQQSSSMGPRRSSLQVSSRKDSFVVPVNEDK